MDESTKDLSESTGATTAMTVFAAWTIRVLLGVLLLLVLLTATILLVQPRLDLTPYRATISQYLSTAVDRDVRLGGDLRVGLGRHLNLSVSGLSVANPAWAESAELFRASEASVSIDLFSALSGVIRLHDVLVRDAQGFMEVLEDGTRSWDLGAANALDEFGADTGPTWRLVVEDARAENVMLLYRGPAARLFQVDIARFDQANDAGMLVLEVSATANELPVQLQGRIGPLQSLIAGRDIEADLRAVLPEGEITAELSVEQRDRPYVDLVATARGLDLGRFVAAEQVPDNPPPDVAAEPRVIPDSPLPVRFLDVLDGRFRITGEALSYPDPAFPEKLLVRDLHLEAGLAQGDLILGKLRLSGDRGVVELNGTLSRTGQGVTAKGKLRASGFRYGMLAKGNALEHLPKHELDMQLTAQGRTYREFAASLDGTALLTGGNGRVANAGIDAALGSFLGELFATINPFANKEPFTQIVCTAAALRVSNGIVKLAPGFVIRTEKLDIAAAGTIDLNSERIDVQFRNTPRDGIGLSLGGLVNRFVKVGGTLAKPAMVLDSGGALVSGTAAAATGGLSVIVTNLLDGISSAASDPCAEIVAGIEQ